jgi:endonuclease/exonuclease/phosphatase family metal-dependent hydrolase
MRSRSISAFSTFRDFLVSAFLWTYAGLVLFTWHLARLTPDWAVLLRVSASILNDLIWIPLGIIVWSRMIMLLAGLSGKKARTGRFLSIVIVAGVSAVCILLPDYTFKSLFIPLTVTVVSAIHALFARRSELHIRGRILPLAILIFLTVFHYRFQMLPHTIEARSGRDIKVMSYNIYCDGGSEDRKKVIETIRSEGADVVCCMEFNYHPDNEIFTRELGSLYPYRVIGGDPRFQKNGALILSKYPITMEPLPAIRGKWSSRISVILAEIDMKGRKIHIVNYHLKSVGHYIEYVADKKLDFMKKVDFAAKNEMIFDREKYTQAQYMIDMLPSDSEPAILCGDLNDTPNSRAFRIIQRKFCNTFSEKGWGLGATFGEVRIRSKFRNSALAPHLACDILRIDHIFASKNLRVVSSRVLSGAEGSDHKPVVSVVEVK